MGEKKDNKEEKKSIKEERIRAITRLYYSKPDVRDILVNFSKNREVIPQYFQGYGKRPDTLNYPSDVIGLVNKGATSFHASEELWEDPYKIDSDMNEKELGEIRKGWDLLIDIDSPYLDCSKIAAKLVIGALKEYGVNNYGLKFSGSKGFHLIVPWKAFPKEYNGEKTKDKFPEWPRAIAEYLINQIRPRYNKEVSKWEDIDFDALEKRTKLKKEDITEIICPECGRDAKKGKVVEFVCPECGLKIERKNPDSTKRRLTCLSGDCAGVLETGKIKDYFHCEYCGYDSLNKMETSGRYATTFSKEAKKSKFSEEFEESISGNALGNLDLVLVASRHLFRAPYSLHEKTSLASVVLNEEDIDSFNPRDASPLKVEVRKFIPECNEGEAERLLMNAIEWKKNRVDEEEKEEEEKLRKKYGASYEKRGKSTGKFKEIDPSKINESMYPPAIKKLLEGISDGRKRGLFVLLTFFKSLNYSPEEINKKVRNWNEKNDPPLKEGYIRSQIDWHLKQKKKILPPNYANESFYRDIGILKKKPISKNPLVDVMREVRKRGNSNS